MKKHFLALPSLAILCFLISAYSTIQKESELYFNGILTTDTIKSASSEKHDSLMVSSAPAPVDVWREWRTVENFAFGKDRGSMPMIADLHSLHPYFRDRIFRLIQNCKAKGIELVVVESYRTHAKQHEYFTMGRKYTRSAGGKSKHQYGLAVDLVAIKDSVAQWDNIKLWNKIGVEGEKLGLRWGGRWKSPYDPAHFEWSGGLTTVQLSAGKLPPIPQVKSNDYPCAEDDFQQLKKHWELWESEQQNLNATTKTAAKSSTVASSDQD
jgi:hypothetical protein